MNELIKNIPVVALRGMTLLPSMITHFDISREKSVKAVETAMLRDQKLVVVTQKSPETQDPGRKDLHKIGTLVTVKQIMKLPQNIFRVLAEGLERVEVMDLDVADGCLVADAATFSEEELALPDEKNQEAMVQTLRTIFQDYCQANGKISRETALQIMEQTDLQKMVDQIAVNIPVFYEEKQKLLEAVDLTERFEQLSVLLENEIQVMNIKTEIQEKVKARVDKNQREYILREQLKVIREELGEDTTGAEADHFQEEADKLEASDEVKERIEKEIERFKNAGNNSAESSVIRGYIETLLELPWDKESVDNMDLANAREILDEDHYGLEKVKERVLEFLAVRALTKKGDSPIICLVGPPGTGKTSIARSIARALDKKYVRICLGGVRDEAEIRGHRRTYIGAMPGRIANGMKQAGVKNPLMLLDEIDKVSSDYKGDTSSALLEVLDSEQNNKFRDHYVELPLDLSEVLFIATANDVQTIPRPLLDRMELIEVSSYTENEKLHIAKEHLLEKQIEKNGLCGYDFSITDKAMKKLISSYTRETGVRSLERKIGEICRKAAREFLEEGKGSIKVTETSLKNYLGKERYTVNRLNDADDIGIVRGLAWTSVGGDTLEIEVNVMPGKGELLLTGQLGDVMKESAMAGISYIRSVSREYGIDDKFFKENDIHIHIPEGAVPKDGPSAGITMATAMTSAITKLPVRADIAMTGEITLRGRVLPIGGLKEKLLAAKNAGIRLVLVPEKNRPDVAEISSEIKKGLEIRFVSHMDEVLKAALVKNSEN
ncbi:endopeptidase La [Fusicatenibacter faecihominis]|uniref:Lon protease n=1 Tax=Fusicatenibacter faecihominis TaxID=2881276 RepID=A0AAE3J4W2_9FIRM|nr:endopeptidase La [Fusicatenibacter faecihominis]MCC2188758.1 endopeptidase La [Fusicatenibacter faecihominis]